MDGTQIDPREATMAKSSKKRAKRVRNLLSGILMFVPAMLAAATAFVNAMQINSKGGVRGLAEDLGFTGSAGSGGGASSTASKSSRSRKKSK
jgi:hypothetical protein